MSQEIVHATVKLLGYPNAPEVSVCEVYRNRPVKEHTCSYCHQKGKFSYTMFYIRDSDFEGLPKLVIVRSCSGCIKKATKLWNKFVEDLPQEVKLYEPARRYFNRRLRELEIPV